MGDVRKNGPTPLQRRANMKIVAGTERRVAYQFFHRGLRFTTWTDGNVTLARWENIVGGYVGVEDHEHINLETLT